MARQIFRQEALERLASPEQLDQLMPVASPRAWIALVAAGLLLAAAIGWSFLGTLRTTIEGRGVLMRPGGLKPVAACCAATVDAVSVKVGDPVRQGQELARLSPTDAQGQRRPTAVVSPIAGRVLHLEIMPQTAVKEAETLVTVEDTSRPLEAIVYVLAREGYDIRPGMEVQLRLAGHYTLDARIPSGRVTSAGRYPASRSGMLRVLANEETVNTLSGGEAQIQVVVELDQASAAAIYSGTPCQAAITVAKQRPIELILPAFGQLGGG